MSITDWPNALRAVGQKVQEHNGWPNTPMPLGGLVPLESVFWHHDASPAGRSPGALDWIIGAYNAAQPSAQIWVGTVDNPVWHFVGRGYASHAGVTRGSLTSKNSVGVETDWTVEEGAGELLFNALRIGFAAICKVEGRSSDFVVFHKTEASPLGRKSDPFIMGTNYGDTSQYFKQLGVERSIIANIMGGTVINPPPPPPANEGIGNFMAEMTTSKVTGAQVSAAEMLAYDDLKLHQQLENIPFEGTTIDLRQWTRITTDRAFAQDKKIADLAAQVKALSGQVQNVAESSTSNGGKLDQVLQALAPQETPPSP